MRQMKGSIWAQNVHSGEVGEVGSMDEEKESLLSKLSP